MHNPQLVERLEHAKYPVAEINVVEHGDDLLEIVATLVSTAIDPNELNAVVADLQRKPGVRHATWELLRALGVRTVFGNPGSISRMMKGTLRQCN